MLRVNLRDGSTIALDLSDPGDQERWVRLRRCPEEITGLAVVAKGHHYALPTPKKFRAVRYDAEEIEHRDGSGRVVAVALRAYADEVTAEVVVYTGDRPRLARYNLTRTGRPVYVPGLDP